MLPCGVRWIVSLAKASINKEFSENVNMAEVSWCRGGSTCSVCYKDVSVIAAVLMSTSMVTQGCCPYLISVAAEKQLRIVEPIHRLTVKFVADDRTSCWLASVGRLVRIILPAEFPVSLNLLKMVAVRRLGLPLL